MAVYVDPMMPWGQSRTWRYHENCHMTADSMEELLAMADRIGLKRSWLQRGKDGRGQPHFDLTASKRRLAVKSGAIEITLRESGEREMAHRRAWVAERQAQKEAATHIAPVSIVEALRDLPCPDCDASVTVEPCCSNRDCTTMLLACRCGGRGRLSVRLNYIEWKSTGQEQVMRWPLIDKEEA